MTVIAWDGTTLAADRRANLGGLVRSVQKLHRLTAPDRLVAYTGISAVGEEVLAWYRDGADPAKFPAAQRDANDHVFLLVVNRGGTLLSYERSPYPVKFLPQQFAIGSGRDFALMAMRLGRSASEAVELTQEFDPGCGDGVDTLTFD